MPKRAKHNVGKVKFYSGTSRARCAKKRNVSATASRLTSIIKTLTPDQHTGLLTTARILNGEYTIVNDLERKAQELIQIIADKDGEIGRLKDTIHVRSAPARTRKLAAEAEAAERLRRTMAVYSNKSE